MHTCSPHLSVCGELCMQCMTDWKRGRLRVHTSGYQIHPELHLLTSDEEEHSQIVRPDWAEPSSCNIRTCFWESMQVQLRRDAGKRERHLHWCHCYSSRKVSEKTKKVATHRWKDGIVFGLAKRRLWCCYNCQGSVTSMINCCASYTKPWDYKDQWSPYAPSWFSDFWNHNSPYFSSFYKKQWHCSLGCLSLGF